MAKTIPQLTNATVVNNADEFVISQSGVTKRASATTLKAAVANLGANNFVTTGTAHIAGNVGIGNTSPTTKLDVTGAINTSESYGVDGVQVVANRITGWTAATGTATRSTFATSTVTTEQLAQRVKALIDDLSSHGLIGS